MKFLDLHGLALPALGLGTWRLAGAAAEHAVGIALELGYRHIDTAAMYGNEAEIGRAVRASGIARDDVVVVTKVWVDSLDERRVSESAHRSRDALDLGPLDLLLAHWPSPTVPLAETLAALTRLRDDGCVRRIGVANFPTALLREAIEVHRAPLACNQVEYHPFLGQHRLREAQRALGLPLVAYCPLAKGTVADEPTIQAIARRHGATAGQVALAWLLAQDGVGAIPKAASERHARENLAAVELTLDEADHRAIDAIPKRARRVQPEFAPTWDPS